MSAVFPLPQGLTLLALRTPTLPPATATNTLIIGEQRLLVVEPASPHSDQQKLLLDELHRRLSNGAEVVAIAITHHHPDHIGAIEVVRQATQAPVIAHRETASRVPFAVDQLLEDGDAVELDNGRTVRAVFCPGHAPGHLAFVDEATAIAHVGDLVAGEGTILIDPDDAGDMADYLDSLEKVRALKLQALVPAHGPVIERPDACLRHYRTHRLLREQRVVRALNRGARDLSSTLEDCYSDTPQYLWPLALRSLRAHLGKLEREGRVRLAGEKIEWLEPLTGPTTVTDGS